MDQKVISKIFVRLQEIFPKWREIWQSEGEVNAAKRQWAKTLVKHGVTNIAMIQMGINTARETGWVRPPSAGQFVKWCIDAAKEQAGIPTKADAVTEIMNLNRMGKYNRREAKISRAIYQMYTFISWYDFSMKTSEAAEKAAAGAYEQMIEHWKKGLPFAEKPVMIDKQKPSATVTEENQRAGRAALKKIMKGLQE